MLAVLQQAWEGERFSASATMLGRGGGTTSAAPCAAPAADAVRCTAGAAGTAAQRNAAVTRAAHQAHQAQHSAAGAAGPAHHVIQLKATEACTRDLDVPCSDPP